MIIWTSIAIGHAFAIVAETADVAEEDRRAIASWLTRLGEVVDREFTPPLFREAKFRWLDRTANHSNWAGAAMGLIAVLTRDLRLFERAMAELEKGLAQADRDGGLPRELARGGRALHYQSFALTALGMLVALADANGRALSPDSEARLRGIAAFTTRAFTDPEMLRKRTGVPQRRTNGMMVWAEMLLPHFRRTDPALAERIDAVARRGRPYRHQFLGLDATRAFAGGTLASAVPSGALVAPQ